MQLLTTLLSLLPLLAPITTALPSDTPNEARQMNEYRNHIYPKWFPYFGLTLYSDINCTAVHSDFDLTPPRPNLFKQAKKSIKKGEPLDWTVGVGMLSSPAAWKVVGVADDLEYPTVGGIQFFRGVSTKDGKTWYDDTKRPAPQRTMFKADGSDTVYESMDKCHLWDGDPAEFVKLSCVAPIGADGQMTEMPACLGGAAEE